MNTPFNYAYDATAGILIAYALAEKATAEIAEAEENERMANLQEGQGLGNLYELQALQARNRARLLQEAADNIKQTVHAALVADFDAAFTRMGE